MMCLRRRFLFVHVPRTGGQSVEHALFQHHSFSDAADHLNLYGWNPSVGWLNHLTPEETVAAGFLRPSDVCHLFKFAFVRNPWDRTVSEYCWKFKNGRVSFRDFVLAVVNGGNPDVVSEYRSPIAFLQHVRPQSDFLLKASGEPSVDEVGRFENFAADFDRISRTAGLKPMPLGHWNGSEHGPYRSYYDDETASLVGHFYASDIERFGYRFE